MSPVTASTACKFLRDYKFERKWNTFLFAFSKFFLTFKIGYK
jgi:hypothetical protein